MRLRAGIDIDGVLTDPLPTWLEYMNAADHSHGDLSELTNNTSWIGPESICSSCFDECLNSPEVTLQAKLYPGVQKALLLGSLHLDMTAITHRRPAIEAATNEWLRRMDVLHCFQEVIIERKSKAALAYKLHLHYHVDDSPAVAQDFAQTRTAALLHGIDPHRLPELIVINKPYNQHLEGFRRYDTLVEAMDFLVGEGIRYNEIYAT